MTTESHLRGWAKGNLQHHLIFDHGEVPDEVPYDDDLDAIHAGHHQILEFIRVRALAALQDAWPTDDNHVETWHPDDQALFRDYTKWNSFDDRRAKLLAQRQRRVLDAVLPVIQHELANALDEYADEEWSDTDETTQREVEGLRTAANLVRDPST